ncbi:MAG: hypothetical protein ABIK37_00195 [candidate division WOR-3 bacterium]
MQYRFSAVVIVVQLLAGVSVMHAQQAENAVIVVIDGLRNDEGFEAESVYLRHLWNDLRPLGTINTRFWNRGWTATTGGHMTILSGVRQIIVSNSGIEQDIRSFDPLAFECYRKYLSAPESSCGVVVGKWGNVGAICDFALEPSFGEGFRGFQLRDSVAGTGDSICSGLVHRAMDSLHPRLLLVNLSDVDRMGHQGNFTDYAKAIRTADSIVYEFYKHIQGIPPYADTFYRDKTLLIVTSDHGRNDNAHGGFSGHGEWDHGSRQVIFYAFGPGVACGRRVDDVSRDLIDITPTVGAVLGFPVPFAEGEVMAELFEPGRVPVPVSLPRAPATASNLSDNPGFSRDPDIVRDRLGNLHLVWSDNTPGTWQVRYIRSSDDGMTWSSPQVMFDYPSTDSVMWYARVAADDSLAVAAAGYGRHACYVDSVEPRRMDTTFLWYPWVATSTDQGSTWSTTSLLDSNMGTWYPAMAVSNGRYAVAWWQCGKFSWEASGNGISFNRRGRGEAWDTLPTNITAKNAIHLAMADSDSGYRVAACVLRGEDWDIACYVSTNGASWEQEWVVSDPNGAPVYDYDPELVVDDSGAVHVFWARKENRGGEWRLMYGRRDPTAGTWDTTTVVTSPLGAWQPHAAHKGDTLALVWIDYRDGASEVYRCFSPNRGLTWSEPQPVTSARTLAQHPRVCPAGTGFFAVWQSLAPGNWDIYGERINMQEAIDGAQRPRPVAAPVPTVVRGMLYVPGAGLAELFDGNGRRVMVLSDEVADETGTSLTRCDVRHLPPGVYFLRTMAEVETGVSNVTKVVIQR